MANPQRVVVQMLDGSARRCTLSEARMVIGDQGADSLSAGLDLRGVWVLKSGLIVVGAFSRWDNGHGSVNGMEYHEADQEEIGRLARQYDCAELVERLPEVR